MRAMNTESEFLLLLDNIESNISSVAIDTGNASEELVSASDYQRKAGRRAACLMIVLVIVVAVVLLAVSHFVSSLYLLRPDWSCA
jgi:t-SNARE complex subunit (syntaxin)